MILVADAAPLIFLSKINQLSLISQLFDPEIFIPVAVRNEVFGPEVPPDEERLLKDLFSGCHILTLNEPTRFAKALSFADNCILTLAVEKQADLILSDDRLLRKTAVIEGLQVVGTIGLLIRAVKSSFLPQKKAIRLLDELVNSHNFRISIQVYEITRNTIDKLH